MSVPAWLIDRPVDDASGDLLRFWDAARTLGGGLADQMPLPGDPALIVSVHAPWGAGKSSFSRLVGIALLDQLGVQGAHEGPLRVEFDAWRSQMGGADLWHAIAWRIGECLYRRIHGCLVDTGSVTLSVGGRDLEVGGKSLRKRSLHWTQVASELSDEVFKTHPSSWRPWLDLFRASPRTIHGRGLGNWEAGGLLASMAAAGVFSVATQNPAPAIGASVKSLADLFSARGRSRTPAAGGTWGIGTSEHTHWLNELLAAWLPLERVRLLLTFDELTRIPDVEVEQARVALSHLREIPGCLVLLCTDDRVIERLDDGARLRQGPASGTAPAVDKLVHIRHDLPHVACDDLMVIVDHFFFDLGLPVSWSPGDAAHPARLLVRRGCRTPRQVKRALTWQWLRLADQEFQRWLGAQALAADESIRALLVLLVELHAAVEGTAPPDLALDALLVGRRSLCLLQANPLDLRAWSDGQGCAGWGSAPRFELIAWLRALEARARYLAEGDPEGLPLDAIVAYREWRESLSRPFAWAPGEGVVKLRQHIVGALRAAANPDAEVLAPARLGAACRRHGLSGGTAVPTAEGVLASWVDPDELYQVLVRSDLDLPLRHLALTLMALFHTSLFASLDRPASPFAAVVAGHPDARFLRRFVDNVLGEIRMDAGPRSPG